MRQQDRRHFFFQAKIHRETVVLHAPRDFHRRLPGYAPTRLIDAPELARLLGIRQLLVKDESSRLGLPAFKILGALWAVYRALTHRLGRTLEPWQTLQELAQKLAVVRPLTLTTATDGNHGRAVAHVAALFGLKARIYLPARTAQARIDAIAKEGAEVVIVDGTYDDAVVRTAKEANGDCLIISDTSWPGYEEIPFWVVEGYSTIFSEIDEQLAQRDEPPPDLIAVQFGIGALASALVRHDWSGPQPKILSVEPLRAACGLASVAKGEIVTVPGPHDSIMAGLNCGCPSLAVWPIVSRGINAFIAIADDRAREAMKALRRVGITAGETGAAGLAGLLDLFSGSETDERRNLLQLDKETRALVLVTEGATDPVAYKRIVEDSS